MVLVSISYPALSYRAIASVVVYWDYLAVISIGCVKLEVIPDLDGRERCMWKIQAARWIEVFGNEVVADQVECT